ncbi:MAG: class B sortase [Oscillospiraceae bacterium]|nr:class B sortase [Oscillospiraceae bacterium]
MSMQDEALAKKPRKKRSPVKDTVHSTPLTEYREGAPVETVTETSSDKEERLKRTNRSVIIFCCAVVAVCIGLVVNELYQSAEAKKNQDELFDRYRKLSKQNESSFSQMTEAVTTVEEAVTEAVTQVTAEAEEEVVETTLPPLELSSLALENLAINKDTAGYLHIPGVIEEPVVQTDNNDFYLEHNFYGSKRQCGTVYADYRCKVNVYPDEQSDNITLYGHNQKDGTMFGNMDFYRWDNNYWLKNPFIYFSNNYEQSTYVIIASFVTNTMPEDDNGNVFDYWNYVRFNDEHTYEDFISEITARTTFFTGVDIAEGDKFLTLSTCATDWDSARHAIVARKLREGETEDDIDIMNFEVNPNPKWPAIYYKYNGGSYSESVE